MAVVLEKEQEAIISAQQLKEIRQEIERQKRAIHPRSRQRKIFAVIAKHGLGYFFRQNSLVSLFSKKKRNQTEEENLRQLGMKLREAFEELGPTFIKLGQVLVTRQDILPEPVTRELEKLLDEVPPLPFGYLQLMLEEELPDGLQTFEWIDPRPLGSASLAQVYRAKMKSGQDVAVKVVRPTVEKLFQTDIVVIKKLVKRLNALLPEELRASLDLTGLVEDYYSSSLKELDMRAEARTMNEHRQYENDFEWIRVPEVYLATKHVLVMEFIDGWTIKEFPVDFYTFEERLKVMLDLAHYYILSMANGHYHADAHGSNILIDRKTRKAVVIDWGMTGKMDVLHAQAIFRMLMHIRLNQAEDATECAMDIIEPTIYTDPVKLRDQLRSMMIHYVNSEQGDMKYNWGALVLNLIRIGVANYCKIPNGLALWAKGFSATEGTARWLCPEISYHTVVESADVQVMESILEKRFNYRSNASLVQETGKLLGTLPRRLNKFLEHLFWNEMGLNIRIQMDATTRNTLLTIFNRVSLAIFVSSILISFSLLYRSGVLVGLPGAFQVVLVVVLLLAAGVAVVRSWWRKKQRSLF
ncbi:MAG: ABC transporter [Bacillus thermozeamaize]|uniref:ABC transporter n=1 Tax=Bacillus thermozeamaize TaxID=230954 RepID=A0A1Y3PI50_9BACI|nr:MAG: ABC transporter [Bacillus thermozeamaize]